MKILKYFIFGLVSMLMTACVLWTPDEDEITDFVEETPPQITYDNHIIYSDSNGDKIINKGETVQLNIALKNTGSIIAYGVKATFSTTSSYLSFVNWTQPVNYGDILPESSLYGNYDSYTIQFTVSSSTPVNTQIPIDISIVDENDNTWTSSFNITVEEAKPQITYDSHIVFYDTGGDKIINNGETVQLRITLKNTGSGTVNGAKATFSTTSSFIFYIFPTTPIDYYNVSSETNRYVSYGYYTIQFTVSDFTPTNTQIPIDISIVDESGNTWTSSFNITVI